MSLSPEELARAANPTGPARSEKSRDDRLEQFVRDRYGFLEEEETMTGDISAKIVPDDQGGADTFSGPEIRRMMREILDEDRELQDSYDERDQREVERMIAQKEAAIDLLEDHCRGNDREARRRRK